MAIFYAKIDTSEPTPKLKWENLKSFITFLLKNIGYRGSWIINIEKEKGKRSSLQNRALHLFYRLLADELNNAGWTVKKVLEKKIDIDWNEKLVKELLWKPAQEAITGKQSTKDLDKHSEIDITYEHVNRHVGEKFGVHVEFPKKEEDEFDISTIYPQEEFNTKF